MIIKQEKEYQQQKRMTAKIRPYDNTSSSDPVGYNDSELAGSTEEHSKTIQDMVQLTTNEEEDSLSDFNPIQPPELSEKNQK